MITFRRENKTQVCLTLSGSHEGQRSFLSPHSISHSDRMLGRRAGGQSPPPQTTGEGLPPPLVCLWRTQQWLFFQSFRLKQTFCIEKIPAHLVSFLLLMASARTICGIKCHALMDRREKNDEKKDKGREQGAAVKICNKNSFS